MLGLAVLIPAIIRGFITTKLSIQPFGAHLWTVIPDLVVLSLGAYWILVKKKLQLTLPLVAYFTAMLGSIVWDYQLGYYALKILFPLILFAIANLKKLETTSIKEFLKLMLPLAISLVFPPYVFYLLYQRYQQRSKKTQEPQYSGYYKYIAFGLVAGLLIILSLAGLDQEFSQFLQLDRWWEVIGKSIASYFYYLAYFVWFFWLPLVPDWKPAKVKPNLRSLIKAAIVMVVAIMVGYSLYDLYIGLRAFKVVDFTFESMGKNTQMQYLEMVVMGGVWLLSGAWVLDKITTFYQGTSQKVVKLANTLLISFLWLVPPVLNIVRVLFKVYIPEFGLTGRRLFGIHTTMVYVFVTVAVGLSYLNQKKHTFVKNLLAASLLLSLLAFALPNNLIIASWHFEKYKKGQEVDFEYLKQVRLQKWGSIFLDQLEPEKHQSDSVWGLMWAKMTKNKTATKFYAQNLANQVERELAVVEIKLEEWDFKNFTKAYANDNYWYYQEGPIEKVSLEVENDWDEEAYLNDLIDDELSSSDHALKRRPLMVSLDLKVKKRVESSIVTSDTLDSVLTRNKSRVQVIDFGLNANRNQKNILKLNGNIDPFVYKNLKKDCEDGSKNGSYLSLKNVCAQSKHLVSLQKPDIPKLLVEKYLNSWID